MVGRSSEMEDLSIQFPNAVVEKQKKRGGRVRSVEDPAEPDPNRA